MKLAKLLAGVGLSVLGLMQLCFALVVVLIPNSVHVDTEINKDMFYSCGNVLWPTTEPYEEPGISACEDANDSQRDLATQFLPVGIALFSLGSALLVWSLITAVRPTGKPIYPSRRPHQCVQ